jgi:formate dehydrogenase assembly factor FdhD
MIAAVALGKDPKTATQTRSLVTQVTLSLPHAKRTVLALIDSGAHENFLSQRFALEEGLTANPTDIGAHAIDGHRVIIYGRYTLET